MNLFYKNKRACTKISSWHRIRINNIHFNSEQISVIAVNGSNGNNSKSHHRHRKKYYQPHGYGFYYTKYFFHGVSPLTVKLTFNKHTAFNKKAQTSAFARGTTVRDKGLFTFPNSLCLILRSSLNKYFTVLIADNCTASFYYIKIVSQFIGKDKCFSKTIYT